MLHVYAVPEWRNVGVARDAVLSRFTEGIGGTDRDQRQRLDRRVPTAGAPRPYGAPPDDNG